MNEIEFERLFDFLKRFPNISPRWGAILIFLIGRCEGFVESATFNTEQTHDYLVDQTIELLSSLPETATDTDFADLIAREFEGWYMTAFGESANWDITKQPYHLWACENKLSEAVIQSLPRTPPHTARCFLNRLLGGVAV
ncbi:hypothetical protein [Neisseria sp.]|uniref:hypothetical protein n=1 Tax=Neisseria sp. TaxID=192066 RepID=UPI0035A10C28